MYITWKCRCGAIKDIRKTCVTSGNTKTSGHLCCKRAIKIDKKEHENLSSDYNIKIGKPKIKKVSVKV